MAHTILQPGIKLNPTSGRSYASFSVFGEAALYLPQGIDELTNIEKHMTHSAYATGCLDHPQECPKACWAKWNVDTATVCQIIGIANDIWQYYRE